MTSRPLSADRSVSRGHVTLGQGQLVHRTKIMSDDCKIWNHNYYDC